MRTDPLTADYEVLVVGAGPVGLTTAHELVRRGVRVRLVDRASGPATSSRALATHARTLEICHQMGVLDRLLPLGRRVEHFSMHQGGRMLVRFDTNYAKMPTRFPFSLMVDQVVTERVLRESLAELGVDVEWSVGLDRIEPGTDSVRAVLSHADGTGEDITVPWLIGTDGAHSTVRKQLGLRLLGDSTEIWCNADVTLDVDLAADSNHLLHTGNGTLLLVPFPERGKWRVVDTVDVDNTDDAELVRARLETKISRALGRAVTVSAPSWVSAFTVQQRMIEQMRVGRCFVAGDAAHVHSPASGQGMNTGIQEGYNLAWKLAEVIRGHARDELLDSYGAERVPIGRTLLGSTRKATALVSLRNALAPLLLPAGMGLLNALRPVKVRLEAKMIRGFCGLALHYADSPLTVQTTDPVMRQGILPGHRVACSVADERSSAGWSALCAELADPRWTLLAFTEHPRPVLADFASEYGSAISVRTVSVRGDIGPAPLADPDSLLRKGIGAPVDGYALIRPDGYLATKGQPIAELSSLPAMFGLTRTCRQVETT